MQTLYKKEGKRYVPISERDNYGTIYPEGFSLVYCKPGCTSFRFGVDPDKAAVYAAVTELLEEDLIKLIQEAFALRPKELPITEEQNKAWDNFSKVMGGNFCMQYDSVRDIANKILSKIEDMAFKNKIKSSSNSSVTAA